MTETLSTFTTTVGKMKRMLKETALEAGDEPFHSDIYMEVHDDRVETIVAKANNSVLTNNTYEESFFDDLELHTDDPVSAIVQVERALNYLGISGIQGKTDVSFLGNEEDDLAQKIDFEGGLVASWMLPRAQEVLDRIPQKLPDRFNEDNRFLSSDGNVHKAKVETTFSTFQMIKEHVDLDSEVDFYPVAVKDESFRLELGSDNSESDRTQVERDLPAESVESEVEEFLNWHNTGYEEIVDTLSGNVTAEFSPDAPMSLVQEEEGKVVRHVLAPVEQSG